MKVLCVWSEATEFLPRRIRYLEKSLAFEAVQFRTARVRNTEDASDKDMSGETVRSLMASGALSVKFTTMCGFHATVATLSPNHSTVEVAALAFSAESCMRIFPRLPQSSETDVTSHEKVAPYVGLPEIFVEQISESLSPPTVVHAFPTPSK